MAPTTAPDTHARVLYRSPRRTDGPALWALAKANGLDENSPYAYLLWVEYFADTTVVAVDPDDDATPIGFVTGFVPPTDPDAAFVWQVGVDADHRRKGIAGGLLDELVARTGATYLEATVTPSNVASDTLFRRFGDRHDAAVRTEDLFGEELFPPGHEAEVRYRIGPVSTL